MPRLKTPDQAESLGGRPPEPVTPLVGRQSELAEVCGLLAQRSTRLLTLTGPGGTGKSRLALAVAAELAESFDQVCFVDLTTVRDAQQVPSALAQALHVNEGGTRPMLAVFRDVLAERACLVIFDNFEHVLGAASFVAELLGTCPTLVILVTSREALAVRSERVYGVEPLPVPDLDRLGDVASLRQIPSVMLFEERARARRAGFGLTEAAGRVVAEICVRLDGLPLAIELAAAQAAVLAPAAILQRLHLRAPSVSSSPRDLAARHQTLEATMGWSYNLLQPEEQAVFRACGVFIGGFTAEAAHHVHPSGGSSDDTLAILARLSGKSLIRVSENGAGLPRFRLLETIRAFALDQLSLHAELDEARSRHAAYYVELAERVQPRLRGSTLAAALAEVAEEYANMRAVFEWSAHSGDLATGLQLAGALYRFWIARGYLTEARGWLETVLPRATAVPPRIRAVALNAAGVLAGMQHDHERATAYFTASLDLWERVGDSTWRAPTYLNLGLVAWGSRHLEEANRFFERAQRLYLQAGDRDGQANTLGCWGLVAREQGDLDGARRLLGEALDLFRALGDDWGAANTLANLGQVKVACDDRAGATVAFQEALRIRRALGDVLHMAECFEGLAAVAADTQPRRAVRLLGAAEALRDRSGAPVAAVDEQRLARLVARLRGRLRHETFESAWRAGRGLSVEQMLEMALRDEMPHVEVVTPAGGSDIGRLSTREREVARLIGYGRTNREIAEVLVLSVKTVESHIKNIFQKLEVGARSEVAVWAARQGLV
ncbi:MAG TPA: tetratricopeptide repeat protein [Chloroflexota bacterium]